MDELKNATERGSQPELGLIGDLAALWAECGLSAEEKLANPGLFMRRQELSYLIADYEILKGGAVG
jgi:hypothetical protein